MILHETPPRGFFPAKNNPARAQLCILLTGSYVYKKMSYNDFFRTFKTQRSDDGDSKSSRLVRREEYLRFVGKGTRC